MAEGPKAPRLPEAASSAWPADLDPDYPDIDSHVLDGETIDLAGARTLSILRSRLTDCELDLEADVPIEVHDSVLTGIDLTGRRITSLTRVRLERCRLGGTDLGDSQMRDVVLDECVLDLSGWRGTRLERVELTGGRIDGLDLSGAHLQDVTFAGIALTDVTWERVRSERVDLTGTDISAVRDIATLKGCTISPTQAVLLAARSARALGLLVSADGAV